MDLSGQGSLAGLAEGRSDGSSRVQCSEGGRARFEDSCGPRARGLEQIMCLWKLKVEITSTTGEEAYLSSSYLGRPVLPPLRGLSLVHFLWAWISSLWPAPGVLRPCPPEQSSLFTSLPALGNWVGRVYALRAVPGSLPPHPLTLLLAPWAHSTPSPAVHLGRP